MQAPKLLIDGDSFLYRAGFAAERTKYLVQTNDDALTQGNLLFDDAKAAKVYAAKYKTAVVWSRKDLEPVENANLMLDLMLRDVKAKYEGLLPVIYLTPSVGNFRDCLATRAKYKGNRDNLARPSHWKALTERIVGVHKAVVTVGQEADDAIGVALSDSRESVIVHIDKDLNQLPGRHYNWVDKSEYFVTPKQGVVYHFEQTLSGDAGDNIPGIDGIGPVKAKALLEGVLTPKEAWARVLANYEQAYGAAIGPRFALEAAQLTYIRRQPNIIWSPPK